MIMEIKRNIADNHVSAYAAQAAYFIMLSLIPLLILLLSMIQFTGIGKADFYSLIQHLVPQGFQSWMLSIIDEMFSRTVATVSLSAVVTIWSAGKSRVDKNPNYVLMRLRGAVFALLFVVIIMVSLVLVVFGDSIHLWLLKYIPFVAVFTRIILSFRLFLMLAILTVFFAALYSMLPNRRSGFLDQVPGALAAAVGWYLFSFGFSIYVQYGNAYSMYGSLTTLILFMFWLYFGMYIVLIGMEINCWREKRVSVVG